MKLLIKLSPLLLIITLLVAGFFGYKLYEKNKNLQALLSVRTMELTKANLDLGRANTKIADANIMIGKLNSDIQKEIKNRNALLTLYAELQGKYEAEVKNIKTITKIVYRDNIVDRVIDLPIGKIFYREDTGEYKQLTSMTWKYSDFRIDMAGDAIKQTISYKLHQTFRGQFVESLLSNGVRNHYFKLYELDDKNKDIGELKLTKLEVIRTNELTNKIKWWNPKLDLAIGLGVKQVGSFGWNADLGISLSTYGKSDMNLLFRFFRFAIGLTDSGASLSFSPFQWNIGQHLPLVSNLWLSPFAALDTNTKQGLYGISIGVVF